MQTRVPLQEKRARDKILDNPLKLADFKKEFEDKRKRKEEKRAHKAEKKAAKKAKKANKVSATRSPKRRLCVQEMRHSGTLVLGLAEKDSDRREISSLMARQACST